MILINTTFRIQIIMYNVLLLLLITTLYTTNKINVVFSFHITTTVNNNNIKIVPKLKLLCNNNTILQQQYRKQYYPFKTSTLISTALFATSSSKLKNDEKINSNIDNDNNKKISKKKPKIIKENDNIKNDTDNNNDKVYPKDSVVSRLKQAAMRASAAAKEKEMKDSNNNDYIMNNNNDNNNVNKNQNKNNNKKLGSLTQLTEAIDRKLMLSSSSPSYYYYGNNKFQQSAAMNNIHSNNVGSRAQLLYQQPVRDSMTAVVIHNDKINNQLNNNNVNNNVNNNSDNSNNNIDNDILKEVISVGTLPMSKLKSTSSSNNIILTKNVAIVFAKPLVNDQITIESAIRIKRLVKSMMNINKHHNDMNDNDIIENDDKKQDNNNNNNLNEIYYKPDIICFVGGKFHNNLLNDCDVCYTYFRNICTLYNYSLKNIEFYLVSSYVQDGAIDNICKYIQDKYILNWINDSNTILHKQQNDNKDNLEQKSTISSSWNQKQRCKIKINFTLVSSEYHLCIINDIHVRSPNQSPLQAFESKKWNNNNHIISNNKDINNNNYNNPLIDISWIYLYATTATIQINDPLLEFLSKFYKIAQELIPVIQNLHGVILNIEFFQQDNYRVLVSCRRNLVNDMEELYKQQPSLQAVQRIITSTSTTASSTSSSSSVSDAINNIEPNIHIINNIHISNNNKKPKLDVVLESALLSMGRCLDLVRPAGLLTGSVPINDFKLALRILEQAVQQITITCDPDEPLHPNDWNRI